MKKYTDFPCFGLKSAGLVWFGLMLVCAWPSGVLGQSGEGPAGTGELAKPKISVYDRDVLSILIDAPAGVKLEVQGSANLIDWKRLAELMTGDTSLIWNPPASLKGPTHFFRVKPMGGPDEAHDGGADGDGDDGGENPGGPDVEKPDPADPFEPGFPDDDDPMGGFTEIGHKSDLAMALAEELLAGIDGQKLELIEVEQAAELSIGEEGTIYLVALLAKDAEGNEFVVLGEFRVGDDGERKLDLIELEESIDPASDLAKRLAKLVMGGLDDKGLTFGSIAAVDKVTDDEGEFYFVHLEVLNGEGGQLEVFGEVEADEQGELKLVHADMFNDGDPFGPDDPDDGIDAIERVDPESEIGQALIEAALAHVDGEGFESVEVVAVDRYNDGDRDMFGVVLLVNGDSQVMTLFFGVERDANGDFKVHEVEDDPFDPNDPDGGMGDVESIDPESDLGQAIVKAAVARLEDAGLKLSEVLVMDRMTTNDHQFIELILVAKDAEGHELTVFAEVAETADGGFDILDFDINKPVDPVDPVDPGFGGKTEELDPESDLVHKLAALALEHADAEGLELDRVTGALRLSFGPEETVYLIDLLVINSDGDVQKAFAEIAETGDGQYEVGHVGIGDDGNWPEPHPEPWPEPHGIIVPPEGSRSHFIDPQGDLASALVTIVHLSIGDHVKTPWEIEHVEEAVRWHVPGEGARFVLLAKGADANGKSGHLLAVLLRKDGSLTIELTDVRTGINPGEQVKFPLPPNEGG
ncbi:MAG: hypothetical protein H8E20_11385 [Verrucomicrobia bacterium]|nr:hypothetical protein [Verrucomicrobiota bacterium]